MSWITALIPAEGAVLYEGVRLQVSATREEAYRDLAEWLERDDLDPATATEADVTAAMNDALDNCEITLWKIEEQSYYQTDIADQVRAESLTAGPPPEVIICKLRWAENELKRVRDHITPAVAPRVSARLRGVLRSLQGAIRNAKSQTANPAKPCPEVTP